MKCIQTSHRDGSISFRLIPETKEESQKLHGSISRNVNGIPKDTAYAKLEQPVLRNPDHGGDKWVHAAGELTYDPIFARRITIWHKRED